MQALIDDEAGLDSEEDKDFEDSSEEDEDEDDDDALKREGEGFLADEDEDEGDEDGGASGDEEPSSSKKKKRRKRSRSDHLDDLDEDDLALLEENTGKQFRRKKRLFKRQQEAAPLRGREQMAREFGGGDLDGVEDLIDQVGPVDNGPVEGEGYEEDEFDDEMDDFIEQDGARGDQVRANRRALAQKARAAGMSTEAYEELLEMLGTDAQTTEILAAWENQLVDDVPELDEQFLEEDELQEADLGKGSQKVADPTLLQEYHMTKRDDEIRQTELPERLFIARESFAGLEVDFKKMAEHVYNAIFGPQAPESVVKWLVQDGILEVEGVEETNVLELRHMFEGLAVDLGTWAGDREGELVLLQGIQGFRLLRKQRRFQDDDDAAANGGQLRTWCTIEQWRDNPIAQNALKEAITKFLQFVLTRDMDVPTVAMFRKEHLGELLSTRSGEVPHLVTPAQSQWYKMNAESHILPGAVLPGGRRIRRWDVLYAVFNEAMRSLQLQQQKDSREKQLKASRLDDATKAQLQEDLEQAGTAQLLEDWKANFDTLVAAMVPDLDNLSLEDPSSDAAAVYTAPRRVKRYARLAGDRYPELAARLAMSAEDFAGNIETIALDDQGNAMGMLAHPPPAADDPDAIVEEFMDAAGLYPANHALEALATSRVQTGLNNAMHCLVEELASCPAVRRTVRRLYTQYATISTVPTESGENELTPFSQLGRVKRLVNKPVLDLLNGPTEFRDLYLRIKAAERQGFLKSTIHIPQTLEQWELDFARDNELPPPLTLRQAILDPFLRLYTGEAADDARQIYQFRASVIKRALEEHLLKHAHSFLLRELDRVACSAVVDAMGDSFWIEATTPPLRLQDEAQGEDASPYAPPVYVEGLRICAVVHGMLHGRNLQDATHMVMLDHRGYPIDHVLLPQLSGPIRKNPTQLDSMFQVEHKRSDVENVVKFLSKHWPHIIVIGASNMHCQQLMVDISAICEKDFTQDEKNEHLYPNPNFVVRYEKDEVASLYEVSAFATKDLKDYTPRVRQAVALGRHCMEPLAVLCALGDPHWELLALNLHPLQAEVPQADRQRTLDQLLCTAIAQTGVNVNAAAQTDWLAPMLAYVPGLGPRKAAQVIKAIKALPEYEDALGIVNSQTIVTRDSLLVADEQLEDEDEMTQQVRVLPTRVYNNAAPFLRLFDASEADHELWRDREEATKERLRFQPTDEDALREIAAAAFDRPLDQDGPDVIHMACKEPNMVIQVDMHLFDQLWQSKHQGKSSRLATFLDLAFELIDGFRDGRASSRDELDMTQEFYALSKETPESMQAGRVLTATARYVGQHFARLETDNGIECMLERRDASRDPPDSLEGFIRPGSSLQVRVTEAGIKDQDFRIQVSSRTDDQDTDNARWEYEYIKTCDPYYRVLTEEDRRRMEAKRLAGLARKQFIARPIQHARFANITVTKSAEVLTQPDFGGEQRFKLVFREEGPRDGDAIFHPSMKGPDRLQLSVRLFCKSEPEAGNQPVIEHLDVMESKKKASDHLTLGSPLMLHHQFKFLSKSDCEFEDLDELLQRFVEPYVMNFKRVLGHRKFVAGPQMNVDQVLISSFKNTPDWRLGLCRGDGGSGGIGYGYIAYMLRASAPPGHFYFLISHRGYYLSLKPEPSKNCSSIEKVEAAFKKHMKTMLAGGYSRQHRPATSSRPSGYASGPPGFGGGGGGGDTAYNGQRGYGGASHNSNYAPVPQNAYGQNGYSYNGNHGGARYAPPASYR